MLDFRTDVINLPYFFYFAARPQQSNISENFTGRDRVERALSDYF